MTDASEAHAAAVPMVVVLVGAIALGAAMTGAAPAPTRKTSPWV